jgi:hypothetical protein
MSVKTPIATVAALLALLAFSAAPALAEPVEAPVSEAATEITGTTATLNGELNPGASATTSYDFEYSPYGYCEVSPTAPQGPVTGEKLKVSMHVTELEANTVYTFCAVALNGADEPAFYAPALTFETLASKPLIPSESATNIDAQDATLEASVNPENRVTTYRFEYATSEAALLKEEGTPLGEASLSGAEAQTAGPAETGRVLQPETTYYYRVLASNRTGVCEGTVQSFETTPLEKPAIDDESASELTQTTAQFVANIDPEFQETLCLKWEYVDAQAFAEHGFTGALEVVCGPENIGAGGGFEPVGSATVVLSPNTTYDFRVLAKNASGTSEGPVATFSSLPYAPEAVTGGATSITSTGETISGSVDPGSSGPNSATTYHFQYGTTTGYGSQAPLVPGAVGEGDAVVQETASLSDLEPDTTYHYRIVATNDNANSEGGAPQSDYGEDETFTTPTTLAPILSGVSVQGVTQNAATISATLNPNGLATRYELQLGSTPHLLGLQASGDSTSTTALSLGVGSLTPGTVYYYKLVATSADGASESQGAFATAAAPAAAAGGVAAALIPYQSIAELDAKEAKEDKGLPNHTTTKSLTKAEKLKKALKACKKDRRKSKRTACEKQAHKKYPTAKSKAKKAARSTHSG